jgi:hypothetical protein
MTSGHRALTRGGQCSFDQIRSVSQKTPPRAEKPERQHFSRTRSVAANGICDVVERSALRAIHADAIARLAIPELVRHAARNLLDTRQSGNSATCIACPVTLLKNAVGEPHNVQWLCIRPGVARPVIRAPWGMSSL